MTAIMVHPTLYRCDGVGCRSEFFGHSGQLPTGWREVTRVILRDNDGQEVSRWLGHECPRCTPPESKS